MIQTLSKREEILLAASNLFRSNGYHATSMRDLASALEMGGSSLYSHVDSKETILLELVEQAAKAFLANLEALDAFTTPIDKLEHLVKGHLRVMRDELPNATVFFHEWRFLPDSLRERITEQRDTYEAAFRQVIESGQREGVFETADAGLASKFILGSLNWTYQWIDPRGELGFDDLTTHFLTLIKASLKVKEEA